MAPSRPPRPRAAETKPNLRRRSKNWRRDRELPPNSHSQPVHPPLDQNQREIRLLKILPGNDGERVECTTQTVCIEQPHDITFMALSYCWGDPNITKRIIVNGTPFDVTVNLEAALRQLRRVQGTCEEPHCRTSEIGLWIDAICINQENLKEKNHQVKLMAEIFSSAAHVLIWLGEGDEGSDRFLDWSRSESLTATSNFEEISAKASTDIRWLSVAIILRPWWTRIWTIQESVLVRNDPVVLCGSRTLEFTPLLDLYDTMGYDWILTRPSDYVSKWILKYFPAPQGGHLQGPNQRINFMPAAHVKVKILRKLRGLVSDNHRPDLKGVMATTGFHKASNPRDNIYALLGITKEDKALKIDVDYDLKTWEITLQTLLTVCDTVADLIEIHLHHLLETKVDEAAPSWLPDLSRHNGHFLRIYWSNTTWRSNTPLCISDDRKFLHLLATKLDTVRSVQMLTSDPYKNQKELQKFRCTFDKKSPGFPLPGLKEQEIKDVLTSSLVANFLDGADSRKDWDLLTWGDPSKRGRTPRNLNSFSKWWWTPAARLRLFAVTIQECTQDRAFFTTEAGLIGVGPEESMTGDILVIPHGADPVVALRSHENGYHTMVGLAYVLGISKDFKVLEPLYESGYLKDETYTII